MTKHKSIPIRSFDELSKVKDYSDYQKTENLIIDYDDLAYVRIMKLFKPSGNLPDEKKFNEDIDLDDYHLKDKLAPILKSKYIEDGLSEQDAHEKVLMNMIIRKEDLRKEIAEVPFHLRFYFPKGAILRRDKKIRHLVIMFNGMDETEDFLLYDTLGEYFVNQGIGAVLIPTQLHLNRQIPLGGKTQTPTRVAHNEYKPNWKKEVNKNPRLFYYHFIRSWYELQELKQKITNRTDVKDEFYWDKLKLKDSTEYLTDKRFYETYFGDFTFKDGKPKYNDDIEFTILGYSLGGLRALSFFLNDIDTNDKRQKSKFHSCITINTCPDLKKAHTKALGITKSEWEKKLMEVAREYVSDPKLDTPPYLKELREIFLNLYFPKLRQDEKGHVNGNGKPKPERFELYPVFRERLEANLNRYLAIASGSDDIVETHQIDTIAPDFKFIHKLTVAGVNHKPANDPNWQDLLPRVESNMMEFINTCNDLHYTKNEILSQIAVIVSNIPTFQTLVRELCSKMNASDCEKDLAEHLINDFTNESMALLLNAINEYHLEYSNSEKLNSRFLKYFYLSKSFFPHFVQTMSKLNEEIISRTDLSQKKLLSTSDVIYEMIKLYFVKEIDNQKSNSFGKQSYSPYPNLFKKCSGIISKLISESSLCKTDIKQINVNNQLSQSEKEEEILQLPWNQFLNRLNKIGITEKYLMEQILHHNIQITD